MNSELAVPAIILSAVTLVLLAGMGALMWVTPRLTPASLFFGWTVTPDVRDRPEGRRIVRAYRTIVVAHTLVAAAVCAGLGIAVAGGKASGVGPLLAVALVPVLWQIGGLLHGYFYGRRRAWAFKAQPRGFREAMLRPRRLLPVPRWASLLVLAAPLAAIVAAAIYLHGRWAGIPEQFPIHWGPGGEADRWARRAVPGVYGLLLQALVLYVLWVTVLGFFRRYMRPRRVTGAAGRGESHFAKWTLALIGFVLGASVMVTVALAVYLPLRQSADLPVAFMVVSQLLIFVPLVVCLVSLVRMGQGGYRMAAADGAGEAQADAWIGDGTDDDRWIGGLFYANRNDPAVMVPVRFGLGWTMNFARPAAWVLLSVTLLVPLGGAVVAVATSHPATAPLPDFASDPGLVGVWRAVDFVPAPDRFDTATRGSPDSLSLKELDVRSDGTVAGTSFLWTRGAIHQGRGDPRPARYEIRHVDGRPYLFVEWISGDVTLRGQEPHWYVLERVDAGAGVSGPVGPSGGPRHE